MKEEKRVGKKKTEWERRRTEWEISYLDKGYHYHIQTTDISSGN